MANYMSKPADYGNYTQPINLELVNFVLQSKQQKYDYNLAKLESKISDELGSIDLARAEDKEYFLNRANETLGSIGNISQIDFSKRSEASNLDSKINSIVDDRVLNDVVSTSNYRNFQKTLQKKQKEGDGTYSQINAAYAMEKQGVNAWLQGTDKSGKKVDSLGKISYEDYVDVSGELKEISENLDKYANVVKENHIEGLYFKNVEGKYLTAEEIKGIAEQQLSDKAKRQIQINGWANYDGGSPDAQKKLTERFTNYAEQRVGEIDRVISKKNLELKSLGDSNPDKKAALEAEIKNYKNNKRVTKESFDSWIQSGNMDSMSSTLEKDSVLTSFGDTFAFNNLGTTYSANQVNLQLQKLQMAAELKASKGVGGVDGVNVTELGVLASDRDEFVNAASKSESWDSKFKGEVNNLIGTLDAETQAELREGYDPKSGVSEEEYIYEKLESLPGNNLISSIELARLEDTKLKRDTHQKNYSDAIKEGFKELESTNLVSVVASYIEDDGIKMLTADGTTTSVKDYLASKGITQANYRDLDKPENRQIKNEILKQYYSDKILSTGFMSKDAKKSIGLNILSSSAANNTLGGVQRWLGNLFYESGQDTSEEEVLMMQRLVELTGSEGAAKKYIDTVKQKGLYDTNKAQDAITNVFSLDPLTGAIANSINRDNSVDDDKVLRSWVTMDKIKSAGGKYLNAERLRPGKRLQAANIQADSDMGKELISIMTSGRNTVRGDVSQFENSKMTGGLTVFESGGDTVTISGRIKRDKEFEPYEIEILKSSLPESFRKIVEFQTDAPIFDRTNMQPMEGQVNFNTLNDRRAIVDATHFLGSRERAMQTTKDGLLINLHDSYPDVMGTKVNPSIYAKAINNMVNSNNVFVKVEETDGKFYHKIVSRDLKTNNEVTLYGETNPIPEESYDDAYRKAKRVPQIHVAAMITSAVSHAQNNAENPSSVMEMILKQYGE